MRKVIPTASEPASQTWSTPAPVGGWNARDSVAAMRPTDALQLDNWFPGTTSVNVRPGRGQVATLPDGEIRTLLGVSLASGAYKRFAASQSGIYDITAGGEVTDPASEASNGAWESVQINVGGISYLWCCCGDGVNKSRLYNANANTWTELDTDSTPALTGVDSVDVTFVSLWKYRLILCERSSMKFYYGALNSVGGAFTAFDLGQVFRRGGYLVATANWTIDAGEGSDDHFVAISSEGEVAVYQGTDPSSPDTFALVGVYHVGKPVGRRCFVQLSGDLGLLTEQGLWPLSRALLSATVDRRVALTDKIQSAFNYYVSLFGTNFGWQPVLLPKGPALLVNVPTDVGVSYQFVMNLITGAWCRFTDWNSSCLLVVDGKLYTALDNKVYEAWLGTADGDSAITAIAASAYTYGPARFRGKKLKMVRPILQVDSPVTVSLYINTDFAQAVAMQPNVSQPDGSATWDSAIWDEAIWGGLLHAQKSWKAVKHFPSRAFSLQLGVQTKNVSVEWSQTDFIGEPTGVSLA